MEVFLWKCGLAHISVSVKGMWFSREQNRRQQEGVVCMQELCQGGLHREHLQQHRKVFWRLGVAILLNNWISTEPRSMTLSTADLFCWIWSYSKRSQIILPGRQENLKVFEPLCSKRCLKSAKAAHRTKEPQNALELLGSIKLSILFRILMCLGCMPSIKRTLTWSRKGWRAASVSSLNLSWKKNKGFVSRKRITRPARARDIPSRPICPLSCFLSFQRSHSLLFN